MRHIFSRPLYWLLVRFLPLLVLTCWDSSAAQADALNGTVLSPATAASKTSSAPKSLSVTIRQITPNGDPQSAICVAKQKCLLPVSIVTGGQHQTLTVQISYAPGSALLTFQAPNGYLLAGEKLADSSDAYAGAWQTTLPQPAATNVTLYGPAVRNPIEAPILNVAGEAAKSISHPVLATLEIATRQAP